MTFESAARKTARSVVSRITTPLWAVTLAGIAVGTATGGFFLHGNNTSEVSALIRLYQPIDPNQILTGSPPSPDLLQSYMSGEIAYLNSPGFADATSSAVAPTRAGSFLEGHVDGEAIQPALQDLVRPIERRAERLERLHDRVGVQRVEHVEIELEPVAIDQPGTVVGG